jgi:20S proteasome subunit beta 2
MKTGTTIAGLMFQGGVVIGADTRATSGSTVLDKMCAKLHYIAPNMYCAGAGTAADTQHVNRQISQELALLRLNTGRESRVVTAVTRLSDHLFQYQGHIGAYLILGGVDINGPQLYGISADGSFKHQPYTTLGSGSLAAMSVFETEYRDGMTVKFI